MAKRAQANCSANRHKATEGRRSKKRNQQDRSLSRSHSRSQGRSQNRHLDSQTADIYTLHSQVPDLETAYSAPRSNEHLRAKTPAQQRYINAINTNALTFGIGPAGTGKSYCAAALAAEALQAGRIERIVLTRPAVEAGENLGFLPGAVDEKFAVYIEAFRDALNERLGSGAVDYFLRHGRIVAAPLAFMRGKTFNQDSFVILDEAQNTTKAQMKMFLTRIGEECKVVVNGDVNQSDIRGANGLADAIERVKGLANVHVHSFEREDIVRSGLVRELLDRYD